VLLPGEVNDLLNAPIPLVALYTDSLNASFARVQRFEHYIDSVKNRHSIDD
jgi:hypothetical protein